MSLENEEQHSLDQPADASKEYQKKSRISYTRDFLLSLSDLDVCKKLPPGFDKSILSEFEDTLQDRQRVPGTFSGYRRNEYSSSPPTRGESGNYSRGIPGRWDGRSGGKSDRDSDTQSDLDSDHGRRHGNQSSRSWHGPEHDGLLGSGSFPRPSGFTAGASAPKFRPNDQYHLSKSNESYHPPRPYKAVPHSRREINDSYNDETFGSTECTSEDRAEEERKRRASFESWRKEQQKAFQEKKINPERRKDDFDISELLVDSKDDKRLANRSKETDAPIPASNIISEKSSFPIQTPASRPLVPPGFASTVLENNFGTKTSMHSHSSQVGSFEIEGNLSGSKGSLLFNGISDDLLAKQSKQHEEETSSEQRFESKNIYRLDNNKSANAPSFSSALDKFNETISKDSHIYKSSSISEVFVAPGNSGITELDSKKLLADKMLTETSQDGSTSILDKSFGSAVIADAGGSTNIVEPNDSNTDETWSLDSSHSSKFAHLFLEVKKPIDDLSPGKPKDFFLLIQGGEKGGSHDRMDSKHVASNFPFQISEVANRHVRETSTSTGIVNSKQSWNITDGNNSAAVPAVLTCEDLEKSILLESTENDPSLPPAIEGWKIPDAKCEKQEVTVDNHASQHLLSMLQNKRSTKTIVSSANHDARSLERMQTTETATIDMAPCGSIDTNSENASGSGKSLTLEALFGSAFMKELQSVRAPASVQRGSIEPGRVDVFESNRLPLNIADDSLLPSTDHVGSNRANFEENILPFTQREQMNSDGIEGNLLGLNDVPSAVDLTHFRVGLGSKLGGFDRSAEIGLPEEDGLLGVSNPVKLQNFMAGSVKPELLSSQEAPIDVAEKLAALKAVFQDERPVVGGKEVPPFLPGHYDMREPDIPFHNHNIQASSPHLLPQFNNGGPLFHSLDSHPSNISSQMKFMDPEGIIHHDAPANHQCPASMLRPLHHPRSRLTGFDPPIHHPMSQQMHMPGNFPLPNLQPGFPGVAPPPPHSNNQITGLLPELNPMHSFPLGHGHWQPQPNFAGLGMPPGHDVGSGKHHPEALQRLIEMELRSKSMQMSPFSASGHSQGEGMYGHELDMGFQYR
ncbi:hypothetical protein V6N12_022475 [Hibiscus sabdariffa]|uniref:Uncharacterized protein n=1 Tax=Hibiscus sabdariffa TaxID=183260 RepID=A0ABR2FVM0_9ROSI